MKIIDFTTRKLMKAMMIPRRLISSLLTVLAVCTVLATAGWSAGLEQGDIAGKYIWETDDDRAELEVKLLPEGKIHIHVVSLRGTKQAGGPDTGGELDFTAPMENGRVKFTEKTGGCMYYRFELAFTEKGLSVKEDGFSGKIGMHAKFEGEYGKL